MTSEDSIRPGPGHCPQAPCPSFAETALSSVITEIAVPLVAVQNGIFKQCGTAVILNNGIAVTAKHIFDWAWRTFEGERMGDDQHLTGTFGLMVIQILNEAKDAALWDVREVFFSPFNDVAFLKLVPTSESALSRQCRTPKINLFPPIIGSKVAALGYPAREIKIEQDGENAKLLTDLRPMTTTGIVKQIHEYKRDSVRLPFPCFQTNARFDDGMSGGPVFDSNGCLCGLICQNLPPSIPGEEHVSYVTTLWPSMATKVDFNRAGYPTGIQYPFLDLVSSGFLEAIGHDRLVILPPTIEGNIVVGLRSTSSSI